MQTCNYAIVRFLPYRETGEFVNVGVVLFCRDAGFFDVSLETQPVQRVMDFFPTLDQDIFDHGRETFHRELQRVKQLIGGSDSRLKSQDRQAIFREVVRPRESVFRFSEVGTVLANDPAGKLAELVDRYIHRQAASRKNQEPMSIE